MKKILFIVPVLAVLAGCAKDVLPEDDGQKVMTIHVEGDEWYMTRATELSGSTLTHLWVFDCVDGEVVQQVAQVQTDDDFGDVVLPLRYGEHELCFVASAGVEPAIGSDGLTITWGKVRDTFWLKRSVTVTDETAGTMSVTLPRVAAKLRLKPVDAVPENAAKLEYTMSRQYKTLDWYTGVVSGETAVSSSANIASYAGTSVVLSLSLWTLSGGTEWNADVTLTAKDGDGVVIGTASIAGVKMKAGRSVEYSGRLFSKGAEAGVLVDDEWSETVTGTW